jgi:DNA helicase HerA-like ATPase
LERQQEVGLSKVTLAPGLSVPADELATQVVAALGMRGSGKSNAMAVIAEGLLTAGVQVIILDYVGIWPSLRLDESGKRPSPHQIPVLGGPHGDTALVPHAGVVVAEALAQSGSPAVLDVSRFSKGARSAFATDFAEQCWHCGAERALEKPGG